MATYAGQAGIKVSLGLRLQLSLIMDLHISSRDVAEKKFLLFSRTKRFGIYHSDVPKGYLNNVQYMFFLLVHIKYTLVL